MKIRISFLFGLLFLYMQSILAQREFKWDADGNTYTKFKEGAIVRVNPKTAAETVVIKKEQLTPSAGKSLVPQSYAFNADNSKLLLLPIR
jgi:hypothetical protein